MKFRHRAGVRILLVACMLALWMAAPLPAAILRVPADHPTIQAAIDAAAPGDSVWVNAGVYTETLRLKSGVSVYGGFAGHESDPAQRDLEADATVLHPAEGVTVQLDGVKEVLFDGFRLVGTGTTSNRGFEVHNVAAPAVIRQCKVTGFRGTTGVGMRCYDSELELTDCAFNDNRTSSTYGALQLLRSQVSLMDCRLTGNLGRIGGAISAERTALKLKNCELSFNEALTYGGALHAGINCNLSLIDCRIENNHSMEQGGGCHISESEAELTGCVVRLNEAPSGGGILSSTSAIHLDRCRIEMNMSQSGGGLRMFNSQMTTNTLTNSIICANRAAGHGGGIHTTQPTLLRSCTITSNSATVGGGVSAGESTVIQNCILDRNRGGAIEWIEPQPQPDSAPHPIDPPFRYCLFYGNPEGHVRSSRSGEVYSNANQMNLFIPGAGFNVEGDPRYLAADAGDFRLRDGSAALDRGDLAASPAEDYAADPRPGSDGLADIGAFEAAGELVPPPDNIPPVSHVLPLEEVFFFERFIVTCAASDAESRVDRVLLYYRKDGGPWTEFGVFADSKIEFDISRAGGKGVYEFRTVAMDHAGNSETPPSEADARTLVLPSFFGTRVFVNCNVAISGTGESWGYALHNIRHALLIAETHHVNEIWVAGGEYVETLRLFSGVSLYGGFVGTETGLAQRVLGAHQTSLDGPEDRVVILEGLSNVRFDGFSLARRTAPRRNAIVLENCVDEVVLQNCEITSFTAYVPGCAVSSRNSRFRMADCVIQGNNQSGDGGVVHCDASTVTLSGCRFTENNGVHGGAISANLASLTIEDSLLGQNRARDGAGIYAKMSRISIQGSTVSQNRADYYDHNGGGIRLDNCYLDATECLFNGNRARYGGGIYSGASIIHLWDCRLDRNLGDYGAGLYSSGISMTTNTLTNCVLFANQATRNGGGINAYGQPVLLLNCTITSNSATLGGGVYASESTSIFNSILDRNHGGAIYWVQPTQAGGVDPPYRHSLFFNNSDGHIRTSRTNEVITDVNYINMFVEGAGFNVEGDPRYVDPLDEDFRLQDGSAALDRGSVIVAPPADFNGEPRPGTDELVDIGAYEADAAFAPPADTLSPVSQVLELDEFTFTEVFPVPYAASDAESRIHHVRLFFRHNGGEWTEYGNGFSENPIPFDTRMTGGKGVYEFYTVAIDRAHNIEAAAETADARTIVITSVESLRLYVAAAATGRGTGESWGDAFLQIQDGLRVADAMRISEVWVAGGEYEENISMVDDVALYGGFHGHETNLDERRLGEAPSVITRRDDLVSFRNVIDATLDGFTIRRNPNFSSSRGILCENAFGPCRIRNCFIENNRQPSYRDIGAGLLSLQSSLVIEKSKFLENSAPDFNGGAVYSDESTLQFLDCEFSTNTAEVGGVLYGLDSTVEIRNAIITTSKGGAIYLEGSILLLANAHIEGVTGKGVVISSTEAALEDVTFTKCSGAVGVSYSTATLQRCTLIGNRARGADGYLYYSWPYGSFPPIGPYWPLPEYSPGSAGAGGALSAYHATVVMMDCVVSSNTAIGGAGYPQITRGGSGYGGGISIAYDSSLYLENSFVGYGAAHVGHGVSDRYPPNASGGGLAVWEDSHATLVNTTISHNTIKGVSAPGGAAIGVHNNSSLDLLHCTIADASLDSQHHADSTAIYADATSEARLDHTLVARGEPPNLAGPIVSLGHNLSDDASLALVGPGDLNNIDAMLDDLADNGGNTLTHYLLPGSPAIDAGAEVPQVFVDQRQYPRPADGDADGLARADIGALERQPPVLITSFPRRETWPPDSTIPVGWQTDLARAGDAVRVELWDARGRVGLLGQDQSPSGRGLTHQTLPDAPMGTDYRLRVISLADESLWAESGSFAIDPRARVIEFWEDPFDVTADDNDDADGNSFQLAALVTGLDHPTRDGRGGARALIDSALPVDESPLQGASGLRWGGFCAAGPSTAVNGVDHGLHVANLETFGLGAFCRQSFVDFRQHNLAAGADFPSSYSAATGSYVYTRLDSNPGGIDLINGADGGVFRVAWNYGIGQPFFRILLQIDGRKWYRGQLDLPMINCHSLAGREPWTVTDMSRDQREEAMQSFALTHLAWERISAAAEADMNRLDDGNETPLGAGLPAQPDLSRITGFGVVLSGLPDDLSVHLMGVGLEGGYGNRNSIGGMGWTMYR